ncbi:TonB-dependent receptor [Nitrospirillum sp. BR 11828]|uniref:TonB-dependent receptor n=1 Tax=Nitrospirillum sp. BR 11828 TaxID=3104325 RepID=UPI002ACA2B48|nr:TonB-dependent receptor [Nitrospirillum sp. BR 11828]MDZ5648348.1 TonB-dependent receptor [Nitrospirillum sp. BR 11828]
MSWPQNSYRSFVLAGASVLVIGALSAASFAQAQTAAAADDDLQEIVVTGQRFAVSDAAKRKAAADMILDSISADDAGKLPDNSVTEVLQRVPGVSITHFAAVGDPDHYSVEGSGVTVRGLSQVSSTLNGREAFSANGGRALLFEDVPPELLAGIDVLKSGSPDVIEGGIGGSVNLRTKMPFDYDHQTFSGSVSADYGDFIDQTKPGGSLLYANRWMTGIGEIGAMASVAYSDISTRHDTIQVEPYFPQTYNGKNVYVPGGFDWRSGTFDRKRLGAYESLEWSPNNDLTFYQTGFRSDYWSKSKEAGVYNQGSNSVNVTAGSNSVFGSNGGLLSSNQLSSTASDPLQLPGESGGSTALANPGLTNQHNVTTDLSQGMKWTPTKNLTITSDFQYAISQSQQQRIDLFSQTSVPSYGINLTGDLPVITVSNPSQLADPSRYIWYATMDHLENHIGRELAWSGDADYHVSDTGFLRSFKVGARFADRTEKDDVTGYNWTGLTPTWNPSSSWKYLNTAAASDINVSGFSNFFRGATNLPGTTVFPAWSLLESYPESLTKIHQLYGLAGDTTAPVTYTIANLSHTKTRTESAYAMARFGDDNLFGSGWKMNGNFGVRIVNNENSSQGYIQQPTGQILYNGATADLPGGYTANNGGHNSLMALPSFNVQFMPNDEVHLRFAAYQNMTNPSFNNLNASGSLSLTTDTNHVITGATATSGNPNLKPQLANNLDVSAEWYMPDGGQFHVAGFYKQIKDYISYGVTSVDVPFALPDGTSRTMTAAVSGYFNAQPAYVKGAEIGLQKFFSFLPAPFDGLGIDTNFTYIYSKSPGDLSYDMLGNRINGLPVDLLSRYNYNITGMYEKGPISARLAYTWRSKYLLTPTANGTNGTYTNAAGQTVTYNLPIFADDYGTLDASVAYSFDDHITLTLEAQNLTNSVTKTLMGYGDQQYGRSWFVADRRYSAVLRFNY